MRKQVMGLDIGYGYTKAIAQETGSIVIPSTIGPAERIRFEDDLISENGNGIALEVDGRPLFVGELAQLQSASAWQTLDDTRTGGLEQKALFYAAASVLIRTTTEEVIVVTGLPVGDYNERNRVRLADMLEGEHEVTRQGKHARQFVVHHANVLPQAIGALYSLVLDRNGNLADGELAAGVVGLIDVGTLTTNFIRCDRLRYVESGSDSINSGTSEILTRIAKDLRTEYGLDWALQLGRVDQAVRERSVLVRNQPQDISGIVTYHFENLAATVISKARSLWGGGADLKAVVVTGGGSYELLLHVKRAYGGASSFVRTADNAQHANAIGFLRAGLRRFGDV